MFNYDVNNNEDLTTEKLIEKHNESSYEKKDEIIEPKVQHCKPPMIDKKYTLQEEKIKHESSDIHRSNSIGIFDHKKDFVKKRL